MAPRRCQRARPNRTVYLAALRRPGSGISGTGKSFGGVNGRSACASGRWMWVGGGSAVDARGRTGAMIGAAGRIGGFGVNGGGGGASGGGGGRGAAERAAGAGSP